MAHEILNLTKVHPTKGYSHVAKAGKTLYIAGQVAKDLQGNLVHRFINSVTNSFTQDLVLSEHLINSVH